MRWKQPVNRVLSRTTGHELRRVEPRRRRRRFARRPGDRLVAAPTFVLCSVRSGSTLLRTLLNSHSQIHAPAELHLRDIGVEIRKDYGEKSFAEIGLDIKGLEYLLWDRILDRELSDSGKRLLVRKTPSDVFIADRIAECWPDARFIFLLRHPAAIARSRANARPQDSRERNIEMVLRYLNALEAARETYDGITVRYEDITRDPARETRRICECLGVPWEASMLEYGRFDHGRYKAGLGDWSENIRSGRVQPAAPPPPPEEIPAELHEICTTWGYLPSGQAAVAPGPSTA